MRVKRIWKRPPKGGLGISFAVDSPSESPGGVRRLGPVKSRAGTLTGECAKTDWQTPRKLLTPVRNYFRGKIPLDAATASNNPTRATRFCSLVKHEGDVYGTWLGPNGLAIPWRGGTFVNPPYGKSIKPWLAKMREESLLNGETIIALLPCARWEQQYFTDVYSAANAYCLIRKRVCFINPATGDAVNGNPYANFFLAFNVDLQRFKNAFSSYGPCYKLDLIP